ncbi:MAG TPA: ester cyclase [Actinomycetota bacterium]|nr:ester cyclase [Actinomycetota bacterium]
MSEKTLLERWFAAGDAGDLDAFDDLLHPDVVVHAPLGLSTTGPDAEKDVWRDALGAMPDIRHEIQEVLESGSMIAARAVATGTLQGDFAGIPANGKSFKVDQGLFARVEDGKIIEAWEIVDTASLLRQLGAMS